ncbi:unnamed protein product [Staurois parvus]|uniref:Uncharacterized protein n=1 Tax=Staurois parvus TaxID=386267 RepID=A0ABN9D687_9NEOB|nr:unnamed protein product [Staurois parvus]
MRNMYTCTEKHVHTQIQVYMAQALQTRIHTCTYRNTHAQTHVTTHKISRHMTYIHSTWVHTHSSCTHTHVHTHTHRLKSCSTSLFTHRGGCCTLGGGREHSTHSFLCFHCTHVLSSLTAPSATDRSGLSSEPAQQDGPGGHTRPHHNFYLPLASR